MISHEQFRELQNRYFDTGTSYSESNPHYMKAKLTLGGISKIQNLHQNLRGGYNDQRHWYQHALITKSLNGVLSAHLLTIHNFYDSAYRDIRTLLETFLVLNYMNDHKVETAQKYLRQERNIKQSDLHASSKEWSWEEIRSEDDIHEMLSEEKNRLRNMDEEIGRIYDYLSNRNVHPTRVDGVAVDQSYAEKEHQQLIEWQLDFTMGIGIQMIKLYSDTDAYIRVKNDLTPFFEAVEEEHTHQKFLEIARDGFPE